MRKLLILLVAIGSAVGAGCSSNNPCGEPSRFGNLFGHRDQAHCGACCESGPSFGMPVAQPTIAQQPCCGN